MGGIKKIGDFQQDFFNLVNKSSHKIFKGNFKEELILESDYPQSIEANFSALIDHISALRPAKNLLLDIVGEIEGDFKKLLNSASYKEFIENLKQLADIESLEKLPSVLQGIINMEVGLAISFAVALKSISHIKISYYEKSFVQYFFSKDGYVSVSGSTITPPKFPKVGSLSDVKTLGSQINAERYIRDLTRIIVETTSDQLYDLRRRYAELKARHKKDSENKLVRWFDSFGDLAEASVLPVVEGILNGAGGLQLNPLVAAGIGVFCSTTTRKATEHAYLELLDIKLA